LLQIYSFYKYNKIIIEKVGISVLYNKKEEVKADQNQKGFDTL